MARSDVPYSYDAEQLVLGLVIEDKAAWTRARNRISGDAFHQEAHRFLWSTIADTYDRRGSCNTVLLFDTLADQVSTVGGRDYVNAMVLHSRGKDLDSAVSLVLDKYTARRRQMVAENIVKLAASEAPREAVLAEAAKLREVDQSGKYKTLTELCDEADACARKWESDGPDFTTGLRYLDEKLGGIFKGLCYVIGAWTSHAKTTLLANLAVRNLGRRPRILYNGFENPRDWMSKMSAIRDGLPLQWYTRPRQGDKASLEKAIASRRRLHDELKDTMIVEQGTGIDRMVSLCEEFRPDIIMVDYIQSLAGDTRGGNKADSYAHFVGRTAENLRQIGVKYNAAMIIASQLVRPQAYDPSKPKEPHLYLLKESGDIENVADAVLLNHWSWRDEAGDKEDGGSKDDYSQLQIIVAKNRSGSVGKAGFKINHKTLAITDWSEPDVATTVSRTRPEPVDVMS